jgi:ABC-type lipoprotein release transport system permease subunit
MSFELFVALRYLLARRKQALISLISVLGVAVGVMALIYPSRQAARLDPAQALRYQ